MRLLAARLSRRAAIILIALLCLSACSGDELLPTTVPIADIQLPPSSTFSVSISGGFEAVYTGTGTVAVDPAIGRAIYLSGERFSANLVMPLNQVVGSYPILPFLTAFSTSQTAVAVGGLLVDNTPTTTGMPTFYGDVLGGRVTLLSIEPMSGAFEFAILTDDGQEVAVRAVFADITLTPPEEP